MKDLISRADAIAYIDRIINSGLGRNKSLDYIRKYISALPSADAEWISCSERLPKVGQIVLASWNCLWSDAIVFARRYCEDGEKGWEWAYEQGTDYWQPERERDTKPEAWMPLPTPYREDGEA